MIKIGELRINYQKELMAVTETPQFSWIIESTSRNLIQDFYRLQISIDSEFKSIVFDSGKVKSEESAHIEIDFKMTSATKYFARVKVWIGQEETEYSQVCEFLSGIIEKDEWQAKLISVEDDDKAEYSNGNYVRKEFVISKSIKQAYAFTTALGLYKLYINGKRVGKSELSPGWTSYNNHLLYQTYDITRMVNEGKNAIGAHIGVGWYKGTMGFIRERNYYGKQTSFLGQLLIRYEDGTEEVVITDETWKYSKSPIVFSEIYDGEVYDATLEQRGWNDVGFDDSNWFNSKEINYNKNILTAQVSSSVEEMEEVPLKQIFITSKGEVCLDFGQNMAGWIHVNAKGKKGDIIELQCFEILDSDGNAYIDNLRGVKQSILYKFGEDSEVKYHPSFTYQGFRYAKIINFPGKPDISNFTAYAVYSNMELIGEFSCSNENLNKLHNNVGWGLRSNFVDIPTDCPQRDERLGWTGDAQIFARTASYIRNTYEFFSKWMRDVAYDQTKEGGVPHVIPDIITGYESKNDLLSQGTHSAAAWADAAVIIPWGIYLNYGDTRIIKNQYKSMKLWIDFMRENSIDNIWNYKLQFGDWVALDAEEGSYHGATPNDLTGTAYYAYSTYLFSKMCGIIGKKKEEKKYFELYNNIVDKFRKTFFDKYGEMTAQTQTAHILALYFKLVEEKYKEKTIKNLIRLLKKENGHLVTGFVGTPYFCHALSENGHTKEAYELLLKEDFPSWLYQVKMGATTIWEHWDGLKPDGTMWSPDMNSFNHYAYGAVDEWIFRVIGGIDTSEAKAGFKHSKIYPHIGGNLTNAKTAYLSPYGKIQVEWEVEDKCAREKIMIPHNTTATIMLFEASEIKEADGLKFSINNGIYEAEAGSGTYNIYYKMM